jgi:hypothetical protein
MGDKMEKEELEKRIRWYEKRYGPYLEKRGLHNWKNLFGKPTNNLFGKPTNLEWTILVMLLLGLFMGWAYSHDVEECKRVIKNLPEIACQVCSSTIENSTQPQGLILKEETNLEIFGDN